MLNGLKLLIGQRISRINLSKPGFDLDIEFSKGLTLKVFCDQTNENDQNDNYMLFTRDQIITAVWGQGTFIAERTVDTHIGTVRKQLVDSRV